MTAVHIVAYVEADECMRPVKNAKVIVETVIGNLNRWFENKTGNWRILVIERKTCSSKK